MYKVMDWVAKKDMVSLAGLDNTDVAGKKAMIETAVLAEKVMHWAMQCLQSYAIKWLKCAKIWSSVSQYYGSTWRIACMQIAMCPHIV